MIQISLDDDLIVMAIVQAIKVPDPIGDAILKNYLKYYSQLDSDARGRLGVKLADVSLAFQEVKQEVQGEEGD